MLTPREQMLGAVMLGLLQKEMNHPHMRGG